MKIEELKSLPSLNIPYFSLRFAKDKNEDIRVFDELRKKFVVLTPEEFVRQNFIHWLIDQYGYSSSHMMNEVEIKLNNTRKRCDTVVYDRNCAPLMVLEYKAPNVEISQDTFDQVIRYNLVLKAKYLIVSNGIRHYCCVINYQKGSYNFIPIIPHYEDLQRDSLSMN